MSILKPQSSRNIQTQQYGDWYTGRWWVGCYIYYSKDRPGWAVAPPSPFLAVPMYQPTHQRILFNVALSSLHYKWLNLVVSSLEVLGVSRIICVGAQMEAPKAPTGERRRIEAPKGRGGRVWGGDIPLPSRLGGLGTFLYDHAFNSHC